MKKAAGTKEIPCTKAMPGILYRLRGASWRPRSFMASWLMSPIWGLRRRIQPIVRRNVGMRIPAVINR